jgi:hypothetical protein
MAAEIDAVRGSVSSTRVLGALVASRSGGDESALVGIDDYLDPIAQVELLQDAGDVGLGGRVADEQPVTDFGVGQSADEQVEHLPFAGGEGRDGDGLLERGGRALDRPTPAGTWGRFARCWSSLVQSVDRPSAARGPGSHADGLEGLVEWLDD